MQVSLFSEFSIKSCSIIETYDYPRLNSKPQSQSMTLKDRVIPPKWEEFNVQYNLNHSHWNPSNHNKETQINSWQMETK